MLGTIIFSGNIFGLMQGSVRIKSEPGRIRRLLLFEVRLHSEFGSVKGSVFRVWLNVFNSELILVQRSGQFWL